MHLPDLEAPMPRWNRSTDITARLAPCDCFALLDGQAVRVSVQLERHPRSNAPMDAVQLTSLFDGREEESTSQDLPQSRSPTVTSTQTRRVT